MSAAARTRTRRKPAILPSKPNRRKLGEIIGRGVSILMPEPYKGEHNTSFGDYLRTGESKIIGKVAEVAGLHKDGTEFPMDIAVSEIRLGDRRLFTGTAHDLTEREQAEEALRESEERFRVISETIELPVSISRLEDEKNLYENAPSAGSSACPTKIFSA